MPTLLENKTIERTLIDLETSFWQAMKDRDEEKAVSMTDDPCLVAGASGVARIDRAKFLSMMKGAKYTLHGFNISKPEFRLLNPDVALLAYEVQEDMTVDGKRVKLEAAETSVWMRHDEDWLCVMHTESLKGDPYGRDKAPAK